MLFKEDDPVHLVFIFHYYFKITLLNKKTACVLQRNSPHGGVACIRINGDVLHSLVP